MNPMDTAPKDGTRVLLHAGYVGYPNGVCGTFTREIAWYSSYLGCWLLDRGFQGLHPIISTGGWSPLPKIGTYDLHISWNEIEELNRKVNNL